MSKARSPSSARAPTETPPRPRRLIWPILLGLACIFTWAALVTFDAGDWPSPNQYPHNDPPNNACGRAGGFVAYYLVYFLGDGGYPLVLFLTMAAVIWLVRGRIAGFIQRTFGLILLCAATAAAVALVSSGGSNTLPEGDGGIVGAALGDLLTEHFSGLGTVLVLGYAMVVGLLLTAEGWVLRLPGMVKRIGQASGTALAKARAATESIIPQPATAAATEGGAEIKINASRAGGTSAVAEAKYDPSTHDTDEVKEKNTGSSKEKAKSATDAGARPTKVTEGGGRKEEAPAEKEAAREAKPARAEPIIKFPTRQEPAEPAQAYPTAMGEWTFPPMTLFQEPEYSFTAKHESAVRAKAKVLEQTLAEFKLDARVVEIDTGPVITMFELSLAPGIKVSQIASLSNDIARALKAPAIRIVAPLAGKNTVGVEVPNLDKEKVRMRELLTLAGKSASHMGLPLFLGKDARGDALLADLTGMPHLLIAGTTGSGKSVCLNSIIASILMTQRPDRCKLILVDPKMVELSQFKNVPHLMSPIVTDIARAESLLDWAVTKMDERYELLAEAGVRDIKAYNKLTPKDIEERFKPTTDDERAQIPRHLPYIVIVIDELADLMMTSPKEVEHHLSRLAQKSRAIGIHIVVATQRPEAKVVTGLIKSNLPCRIAFRVASRMDSRIVLDQNGAEVLMGQGDMLFLPPGSAKLMRAQGTYLEDAEVHAVIEWLAERAQPEFHPQLIQLRPVSAGTAGEGDELFDEAVRIILETGRGSVSLLQRRLNVGYSRASRLIEMMSDAGIIGAYKGSQAREVQMTLEEWEALRAQVSREKAEGYAADEEDEEDSDH